MQILINLAVLTVALAVVAALACIAAGRTDDDADK